MTAEVANYPVNQIQEMIQKGVKNEMDLWYQLMQQNENIDPNSMPTVPSPPLQVLMS